MHDPAAMRRMSGSGWIALTTDGTCEDFGRDHGGDDPRALCGLDQRREEERDEDHRDQQRQLAQGSLGKPALDDHETERPRTADIEDDQARVFCSLGEALRPHIVRGKGKGRDCTDQHDEVDHTDLGEAQDQERHRNRGQDRDERGPCPPVDARLRDRRPCSGGFTG